MGRTRAAHAAIGMVGVGLLGGLSGCAGGPDRIAHRTAALPRPAPSGPGWGAPAARGAATADPFLGAQPAPGGLARYFPTLNRPVGPEPRPAPTRLGLFSRRGGPVLSAPAPAPAAGRARPARPLLAPAAEPPTDAADARGEAGRLLPVALRAEVDPADHPPSGRGLMAEAGPSSGSRDADARRAVAPLDPDDDPFAGFGPVPPVGPVRAALAVSESSDPPAAPDPDRSLAGRPRLPLVRHRLDSPPGLPPVEFPAAYYGPDALPRPGTGPAEPPARRPSLVRRLLGDRARR